jgi:general secretion pathway protein L
MSAVSTEPLFFGLDLASLRRDLATAWRGMLDWPVFAWLWPKLSVRLWLPDGKAVFSRGPGAPYIADSKRARSARFDAVQLPEHLVLRKTLQLPQLQAHELQAALSLEASGLSPFVLDDLTWTHAVEPDRLHSGVLTVHLAMASRKLVTRYIEQAHPAVMPANTEVWVPGVPEQTHLVLPGFGEAASARHSVIWRWASVLLLLLALALVAAIGITPSVQLFLRAQQAHIAMADLQQKAIPVVKQRESLVHTSEQLSSLNDIIGKPLPPLQVLKLITDALPDDTSLLTLQVQGVKVTMSGQTANAAVLMRQLGATAGLRDVTAPTPAVKPLGVQREQFTIEFKLDSAQIIAAK